MEAPREVLGEHTIVRLLLAYPGQQFNVPRTIQPDHPIAQAIGSDAASKLAKHLGGGQLYIPASFARAERNRAICEARLAGDPVDGIARRHRLTARHVMEILAKGVNSSQTAAREDE